MTSTEVCNATTTEVEATSVSFLSIEERLEGILCEDIPLDSTLTVKAQSILDEFLHTQRHPDEHPSHKRKFDDVSEVPTPKNRSWKVLAKTAISAADVFCQLASAGAGKGKVRRSLEDASQQFMLVRPEESDTDSDSSLDLATGSFCIAIITLALALRDPKDRDLSRAAVSAMTCSLQRTTTKSQNAPQQTLLPASSVVQAILLYSKTHRNDELLKVDWHSITSLARALGMDGSQHAGVREAVATIVSDALCLREDDDDDNDDSMGSLFELLPDKIVVAGALALAAQMKPWEFLPPARLIEAAVPFDLWHAAERVCASVAITMGDSSTVTLQAVESLIDEAMVTKTYRRADTFATQFYRVGGNSRFLEARLLHACDTIAKVIQKQALPVIERQIARIDRSAERVVTDEVADEAEASRAKDEIRDFALRQLEETGNIDTAHRLAGIYELSYAFDEEAMEKAAAARREKYLQWEDLLPGSPPDLVASPTELLAAFSRIPHGGLYGFDVEWSDDDAGAALLQIAFPDNFVILIDIPALSMTIEGTKALESTVGRLFTSDNSVVVGFGCRQDAAKLRASPCLRDEHWFQGATAVADLQRLVGEKVPKLRGLGLSRVCDHFLGKPLDKSEQCSFWSARPLSIQQRTYAALDAWVCLAIHRKEFPLS